MANEAMDFSDERGKLFVGGLSWETTQENLQNYFSRFGEVVDCVVMKNNETGRSRGFGFVTFADPNNVDNVLHNGPHELDSRTIDPKPCNPRYMAKIQKGGSYPKVFLGGLPANVTETDLRQFFSRFGKVMEVVIMYDQERKKSRGFGFLSFEEESSVERATAKHYVTLHGKQVEVKKAEPREGGGFNKTNDRSGGMRGGPHGFSNGQMGAGGPHMSHPGNMQGFQQQGWGAPPQQQGYGGYNYGAPSGPQSYQGWGAPQGPPQQQGWGASFSGPPQPNAPYGAAAATGYSGGYDMYGQAAGGQNAASAGSNWNYSSWPPQGSTSAPTPPSDPTGGGLGHAGAPDYSAYGTAAGAGGGGGGGYNAFGNYGTTDQSSSSYGPIRNTYDNKKQGVSQPPYHQHTRAVPSKF